MVHPRDRRGEPPYVPGKESPRRNAGNIGGLFATPVINYPEAAILGVHAIKRKPWVVGDKVKIRDIMYLSISIDHRMNDGAVGAHFMNHVIALLENPDKLMLEL